MNISLANPNVTLEEIQTKLHSQFPNYQYFITKNFFGDYISVKKSSMIGAAVQKRKDNTLCVYGNIPTLWARSLLGGLLFIAFIYSSLKKVENEVGGFLQQTYGR